MSKRIPNVIRLFGRLGFAFVFCVVLAISNSSAQMRILWTAEFAPTTFTTGYSILDASFGVVVVGTLKDQWNAQFYDGFVQVLDPEDGHEISFARHHFGLNTIYRVVAPFADGTLGVCGRVSTFDGLYSTGIIARMTSEGDTLWTRVTQIPESRDANTIDLISDTTFIVNASWQDPEHLGKQMFSLQISESGLALDSSLSSYVYGEYIKINDAIALPEGGLLSVGEIYRIREPLLEKSLYMLWMNEMLDTIRTRVITLPDTELWAGSVDISADGDIFVSGFTSPAIGSSAPILFKFSSEGEELWHRTYFSGTLGLDGSGIRCMGDSLVLYSTEYDFEYFAPYLAILDSNGGVITDTTLVVEGFDVGASNFTLSQNRDIIYCLATGETIDGPIEYHEFVFCIALDSSSAANENPAGILPTNLRIVSVFPNPTNASSVLTFELAKGANVRAFLTNTLGQNTLQLFNTFIGKGEHQRTISLEGIASGRYFVVLESNTQLVTKSVIVIR